jgi:hypothetical protein
MSSVVKNSRNSPSGNPIRKSVFQPVLRMAAFGINDQLSITNYELNAASTGRRFDIDTVKVLTGNLFAGVLIIRDITFNLMLWIFIHSSFNIRNSR